MEIGEGPLRPQLFRPQRFLAIRRFFSSRSFLPTFRRMSLGGWPILSPTEIGVPRPCRGLCDREGILNSLRSEEPARKPSTR